jgi:pyrimidine oxygenase
VKALVWVSVIADDTDAAALAKWEHYKAGTDLEALGWSRAQADADVHNDDPNSTKGRMGGIVPPSPTTAMKLIGSYATVARLLDEMAAMPGMEGAMLSFDDFRLGVEQFGQRIQPQMRSRVAVETAVRTAA